MDFGTIAPIPVPSSHWNARTLEELGITSELVYDGSMYITTFPDGSTFEYSIEFGCNPNEWDLVPSDDWNSSRCLDLVPRAYPLPVESDLGN